MNDILQQFCNQNLPKLIQDNNNTRTTMLISDWSKFSILLLIDLNDSAIMCKFKA